MTSATDQPPANATKESSPKTHSDVPAESVTIITEDQQNLKEAYISWRVRHLQSSDDGSGLKIEGLWVIKDIDITEYRLANCLG